MKELAEQRLTIIEKCDYTTKSGKKMPGYLCKCECGNIKVVSKNSYDSGKTKSCGCLIRDFNAKRGQYYEGSCYSEAKKYGVEESVIKKIVSSYKSMMTRCRNPHHIKYKNYGGRGISVCEEWVNSKSAFIQCDIVNITLHFFLKDVRSMQHPVMNHSTAVA